MTLDGALKPGGFIPALDGTEVDAFLNATDGVPGAFGSGTLGDVSVAVGRLAPGVRSAIHAHPVVTQLTYVVAGQLTTRTQDAQDAPPREVIVNPGEALLTEPGNLLELRNDGNEWVRTLYIVTPSYAVERDGDSVIYEDAVLLEDWCGPLSATARAEAREARDAALARLARRGVS